jgi:hypothetical protein
VPPLFDTWDAVMTSDLFHLVSFVALCALGLLHSLRMDQP